jgi:dipeptidyl aminopeptidase/acylaminoacyl peptidase
MTASKRVWVAAAVGVVVVAGIAVWLVYRADRVNDPADAACPNPATSFGAAQDQGDHAEVAVHFTCEDATLVGTIYLPKTGGRHPGAVWVHGAGEAPRLTWGGDLLPGLVHAGVVVLSYDKRGVGESEGDCCPGDTGHFNLLTADAVAAVAALRERPEVDPTRVGLVGASQAGWIAPRAADKADAAFVALAAAPTIPERTSNLYEQLVAEGDLSREEISTRLREEGSKGYDPKPDLSAMTMPGLWEFGTADENTPSKESVTVLRDLKPGHDFTVMIFPGAGHGLLDNPPTTPDAIPRLINWVERHDG